MNFYGHVTQSIGGYGIVSGHRIGIFGATGTAPTQVSDLCPDCLGVAGRSRHFDRIGADASTTFGSEWNLFGAWMHARDSVGLFNNDPANTNPQQAVWNGGFVELDYSPQKFLGVTDLMFLYRYDLIRNVRQGTGDPVLFPQSYNDVDSHTWMVRYFLHYSNRTDIAFHLEFNVTDVYDVGVDGRDQEGFTTLAGFDFAF